MKILELHKISKKYDNVPIIKNFSMSLNAKERLAIWGASGKGKTSLLNIILGISDYDDGIILKDECLHYLVVFQENRLLPSFNALDNMDVYPYRLLKNEAVNILDELELKKDADKPAAEYSGGMKRRLAIARALYGCVMMHAHKPDEPLLLIMDEPFKGLDDELKEKVIKFINHILTTTGSALVLVTHDKKEAAALGCGIINLNQ